MKRATAEPFGNPDGSRADIEDILEEFVEFDGEHLFGGIGTKASDSKVRVIVGKVGTGKTVYMRRLQAFQSNRDSVYADVPQQRPPTTETVVKACPYASESGSGTAGTCACPAPTQRPRGRHGPAWSASKRPPTFPPADTIALADLSQTCLPRFASTEHKDPRAPQNLYPIAGLERELRRRLGDHRLLYRALGKQHADPAPLRGSRAPRAWLRDHLVLKHAVRHPPEV